jgi:hypothetical protein
MVEVLEPDRRADALAYQALAASDLWSGEGWNFVFGQANLTGHVGVWPLSRNGDPTAGGSAFRSLMNGSNHQGSGTPGHCTCAPSACGSCAGTCGSSRCRT